jgi:hypothetical protein
MTRFCGCCLSLAFLVCFSYTTHNWHDDGSGDHFTISARAALAFQFFSFVLWAFPSVLVLIYCILDKRDIRRHSIDIGRLSTNPAESGLAFRSEKRLASEEERVNPVLRSVHPSFVTTSYYEGLRWKPGHAESSRVFRSAERLDLEEERLNPVSRSVHPSSERSYYEGSSHTESRGVFRSEGRLAPEEERLNPVSRSTHPSSGRSSYYEGLKPLPGSLPSTRERSPYGDL